MIWQDVEPGMVLQDSGRRLWVVVGSYVRMDDPAHPFLVVRIYCLSDPEHAGSSVYAQAENRLEDTQWSVWEA